MDITKVTLRPVAMNKVCAIASVVIDDQFVVHDLRVVNKIQQAVLDQFQADGGLEAFAAAAADSPAEHFLD